MDELQKYEPSKLAAIKARQYLTKVKSPSEAAIFIHASKETKDLARKISNAMKDESSAWLTAFEWEHTWLEGIRHAGRLIAEGQERGEIANQGNQPESKPDSLSALGISHMQSSRWQRISEIHDEDFRLWVEERKEKKQQLTQSAALRLLEFAVEWPELPAGVYNIIYADPPWRYDFSISPTRTIERQYETLDYKDIAMLSMEQFIAEDSVLFLWVPNPKLNEGLFVMKSWDFDYKTNMVWAKDKIGMGYYARQQHELLLIGAKGSLPQPAPDTRPPSIISGKREEHSRKPAKVYELIEQMYPNEKYLELFARQKRFGWTSWGNEI